MPLFPSFSGESEQRLRDAFATAQHDAETSGKTALVFLDELDTLAPRRAAVGGGVEARVVGQLLTLIDQVCVFLSGQLLVSVVVVVDDDDDVGFVYA